MIHCSIKSLLAGFLFITITQASAQKNILISPGLEANSEKINIKVGAQWFGKIYKIRFGDYSVVSSKMGWATTTIKHSFFGNQSSSKATEKFMFVLGNNGSDSSWVHASRRLDTKSAEYTVMLPVFFIGVEETLQQKNNFSAFITINRDTTETWALFMDETTGTRVDESYTAFLTNGTRKIMIFPSTSDKPGEKASLIPADGFEFFEKDQSICAMQLHGGGISGLDKRYVWIDSRLEPKMKLMLASAITAILQVKVSDENKSR
ncbi:MAG: hypothetical protein WCO63_08245 [Bacteroidota bacterium]